MPSVNGPSEGPTTLGLPTEIKVSPAKTFWHELGDCRNCSNVGQWGREEDRPCACHSAADWFLEVESLDPPIAGKNDRIRGLNDMDQIRWKIQTDGYMPMSLKALRLVRRLSPGIGGGS
jgi:hypothetical protein